ncbi:hypothetical protein Tco_1003827 [Tanacetum coccineum]|uniref:Uncharacterized protein n=1 Tax=Tanacetum coccineum TaxID=301880 RepID=A0ABQ5FB57_9ASTR
MKSSRKSTDLTANTPYYSRPIRRIQDFDESKDHCLALKNMPYLHQRYAIYNTLVNKEEQAGFTQYAITIERLKQGENINRQDVEIKLFWKFGKFISDDEETLKSHYTRFYRMMNELVRNKLIVNNHQISVQFLLQPEWSRFMTTVKQAHDLKTISYHTLFDILKQHQNKVNELIAERLARTANLLALVATTYGKSSYNPQALLPSP